MADWYLKAGQEGESEQSRLARILDIAQDLKVSLKETLSFTGFQTQNNKRDSLTRLNSYQNQKIYDENYF